MIKGLEHLSYERALRQSVLKGDTCEKDGNRFFSRACCNRTRGYGFKLKQGSFKIDRKKKFFIMIMANTGTGCPEAGQCPIPENIQGHVEQGSKQSDLVEDVPDDCRGVGPGEF